jgi:hypothetical protein
MRKKKYTNSNIKIVQFFFSSVHSIRLSEQSIYILLKKKIKIWTVKLYTDANSILIEFHLNSIGFFLFSSKYELKFVSEKLRLKPRGFGKQRHIKQMTYKT